MNAPRPDDLGAEDLLGELALLTQEALSFAEWAELTGGQDWPISPPEVRAASSGLLASAPRPAAPPPPPSRPVEPRRAEPASKAVGAVLGRVMAPLRARAEALERVAAELAPACQRCTLAEKRQQVLCGAGRPSARVVVLGDQPAPDDDRSGEPFAGTAGLLLTRMLKAIGLPREAVFLTHLVKCHAADGRDPSRAELDACRPFLVRQLEAIAPAVILTLGPLATAEITGATEPFGQLRGRVFEAFGARIVPTYHPAYLLREPRMKRHAWQDLCLLPPLLDG